jgi:hypothetical protein
MVLSVKPVPSPPPIAGAEAKEPPGPLLPVTHHERQIPHHASQIATVDVGKETRVDGRVGGIFEGATPRFVEVLNVAAFIQD